MSKTILTGNLGNVPEIHTFESGKVKATFSIATEVRDAQGNKTTVWHRVSLWGKRAERAANLLYKGAKVLVHGEESQRPFTDKSGNNRVATEFAAQNFYLLAKPVKAEA
jgi:single-strand DNA-binding protein